MALAVGDISTVSLCVGVQAMAEGQRASPDALVVRHPNGWGLAHFARSDGALTVRRDLRPLGEVPEREFPVLGPGVTVVHARHATLEANQGLEFSHPLIREGVAFCHNGFAPDANTLLGRETTGFDSRALFDLLVPTASVVPDESALKARLSRLSANTSSANAFIAWRQQAFIINWFGLRPDFYTLWLLKCPRGAVCASEILPEIAPAKEWQPLGHGAVIRLIDGEVNND